MHGTVFPQRKEWVTQLCVALRLVHVPAIWTHTRNLQRPVPEEGDPVEKRIWSHEVEEEEEQDICNLDCLLSLCFAAHNVPNALWQNKPFSALAEKADSLCELLLMKRERDFFFYFPLIES